MKYILGGIIGASMVLSFSAEAVSCRDIGTAVVDQYVAVARYKVETPAQIDAYKGLVESQVSACENGKRMRLKGASPKDAGVAMTMAAAHAIDSGNSDSMPSFNAVSMTQTSFSYGYSFAE